MKPPRDHTVKTSIPILLAILGAAPVALAQEGRPQPRPAVPASHQEEAEDRPDDRRSDRPMVRVAGRRDGADDLVVLAFDKVTVEETIPFIVEATGKVVVPINLATLSPKKITLINDRPISRMLALDYLFQAFQLNDVGVIEEEDRIIIGLRADMPRRSPPVYGPEVDLDRDTNLGTIITKIFAVENTDAENIAEKLQETMPDDAFLSVDSNSNQIIVTGDVALCQRLGTLIRELDRNYIKIKTATFRLAHADASEIAQNIIDLFENAGTTTGGRTAAQARQQQRRGTVQDQRRRAQQAARRSADEIGVGPTVELRITVNVQQNSVTVSGEPTVVDDIAELIAEDWDLPRAEATKKVYRLKYTDPIKMRDMLHELLGQAAGGVSGAARRGRAGTPGGGQRADVAEAIGGIFQIQAYPDSNSLVVISKTEEAFTFLDSLIEDLDQPINPGLPLVVELKHADAEEIADQINAIFAIPGTRVDIQRRDTGLAGGADLQGPAGGGDAGPAREGEEGGAISLPWMTGREREDEVPPSSLIGKVRVVPIHRQNALMILAAPEYLESVRGFVDKLDKPGRQVMISAVIAEVELTDELALGIRFSNSDTILGGSPVDNRIGANATFAGSADNIFRSLFDTSTIDVGIGLNVVLQALAQNTKIRILQEPAIFTADNQEASFFEGQDVPVLQSSQTTAEGTVNETTEYFSVGINLNVRPRITTEGDVDMEINLEISNIDVAASAVAVSPVFDRRETTTQIIVKDGQTIVLSGIMRDLESRIERKVPILGDIPIVGELFKSYENQTSRTELIAFITPIVVDNPEENDTNFNERARERLENLSRPLKEQERDEPEEQMRKRRRLFLPAAGNGSIPPLDVDELINER